MVRIGLFLYRKRPVYQWELIIGTTKKRFQKKGRMEMKEYLEKSSKILDELQTTEQGLSEAEAARRLSEHGPNRLADGKKEEQSAAVFRRAERPDDPDPARRSADFRHHIGV